MWPPVPPPASTMLQRRGSHGRSPGALAACGRRRRRAAARSLGRRRPWRGRRAAGEPDGAAGAPASTAAGRATGQAGHRRQPAAAPAAGSVPRSAAGSARAKRASSPTMNRVSTSDVPPAEISGSVDAGDRQQADHVAHVHGRLADQPDGDGDAGQLDEAVGRAAGDPEAGVGEHAVEARRPRGSRGSRAPRR